MNRAARRARRTTNGDILVFNRDMAIVRLHSNEGVELADARLLVRVSPDCDNTGSRTPTPTRRRRDRGGGREAIVTPETRASQSAPFREENSALASRSGKRCRGCEKVKRLDAYPPDKRATDGRASRCRACLREGLRAWRKSHPESVKVYRQRHRSGGQPRTYWLTCAECGESFEAARPQKLTCSRNCADRRYRRLHPDKINAKRRRYHARRRGQGPRETGRSAG